MSRNLTGLSFRKGLDDNVFERMAKFAEKVGTEQGLSTAELHAEVHRIGEETLFGDATSLGAVSFYDYPNRALSSTKVLLCNGSACLCAGTQDNLHAEA